MNSNNDFLVLFLAPGRDFLADDGVSEILINGAGQIYVERSGKLELTNAKFASEAQLMAAAVNIAKSVDRILDRCGTIISIRKFKKDMLTLEKLEKLSSIPHDGVLLLNAIVKLRKNVLVSGGTSSGKTSVLNAISGLIPDGDRILVLEDASELQLQQRHCVYFETRKPDKNGEGEFSIRDLVIASLRMRPDRLVIGEIRGGEALDLLQAMNTGHSGSMSTIHANSPVDALRRMETCAILSGVELPLNAVRMQVASAINCIVHTMRLPDGSRKIVDISEVLPLKDGEYQTSPLLKWNTRSIAQDGSVSGDFSLCNKPSFAEDANIMGLELPKYE